MGLARVRDSDLGRARPSHPERIISRKFAPLERLPGLFSNKTHIMTGRLDLSAIAQLHLSFSHTGLDQSRLVGGASGFLNQKAVRVRKMQSDPGKLDPPDCTRCQ